jgi:hypothetical protein
VGGNLYQRLIGELRAAASRRTWKSVGGEESTPHSFPWTDDGNLGAGMNSLYGSGIPPKSQPSDRLRCARKEKNHSSCPSPLLNLAIYYSVRLSFRSGPGCCYLGPVKRVISRSSGRGETSQPLAGLLGSGRRRQRGRGHEARDCGRATRGLPPHAKRATNKLPAIRLPVPWRASPQLRSVASHTRYVTRSMLLL